MIGAFIRSLGAVVAGLAVAMLFAIGVARTDACIARSAQPPRMISAPG